MIKVNNLTKEYRVPKQASVKALKGINLEFGNNGMIFILGKSGSGKSTLLNVLGGLDTYEGGDIIINGKSTKDFASKDYDTYRNSLIGFVFQEFYLLNQYTVGKNISLALELQNKKNTKPLIADALKMVELEGYEKRRANTLSGGEKQRVAVARALVKNPEIILADEPTGNLDSETGEQVFDILKKISKEKLVIVVSHDRETAFQYGDRIIELADGEVIDDKSINEIIEAPKKVSTKIIKSRLPLKNIIPLGAAGLKNKSIRLTITILLFAITIITFGFGFIAATYEWDTATLKVCYDNNIDEIILNQVPKGSTLVNQDWNIMTKQRMDFVKENNEDFDFYPLYGRGSVNERNTFPELFQYNSTNYYYTGEMKYAVIDDELMSKFDFEVVAGVLPQNKNEIALPIYLYQSFERYGYKPDRGSYKMLPIKSYTDMLGKTLTLPDSNIEVKVTAIVDTKLEKEFTSLKDLDISALSYIDYDRYLQKNFLLMKLQEYTNSYYHGSVFVAQEYIDEIYNGYFDTHLLTKFAIKQMDYSNIYTIDEKYYIPYEDSYMEEFLTGQRLRMAELLDFKIERVIGEGALEKNEIIVSQNFMKDWAFRNLSEFDTYHEYMLMQFRYFDDDKLKQLINNGITMQIEASNRPLSSLDVDKAKEYTIVGYWKEKEDAENIQIKKRDTYNYIFMNDEVIYAASEGDNVIKSLVTKLSGDKNKDYSLIRFAFDESIDEQYNFVLGGSLAYDIMIAGAIAEDYRKIGLYASLVFGIFSIVMMLNFITISISSKKKEIGILRALGTKNKYVFQIFYVESLIISLVSVAVGLTACALGANFLNSYTFVEGFTFRLFNMNLITVFATIGLGLFISIAGCILPLIRLMKKKPVEIIRNA